MLYSVEKERTNTDDDDDDEYGDDVDVTMMTTTMMKNSKQPESSCAHIQGLICGGTKRDLVMKTANIMDLLGEVENDPMLPEQWFWIRLRYPTKINIVYLVVLK